jgi:hypothetical protein
MTLGELLDIINEEESNNVTQGTMDQYDILFLRPDNSAIEIDIDKIDHQSKTINFK